MGLRKINRSGFNFIKKELTFYQEKGLITSGQTADILASYEVKPGLNFLKVVLFTGAVLVGLGVLSFIASNWDQISKLFKYLIILGAFIGVNLAGFLLEEKHPKTGRSLLYLGILIFGAGIFLTGQIFNFGGHFTSAFLLWALGVLPAAVIFRDKYLYSFVSLLLLVYINGHFDLGNNPWAVLAFLPVLYYCSRYLDGSDLVLFSNNLVFLNTIGFFAIQYEMSGLFTAVLFFVISQAALYFPWKNHKIVFQIQGSLLMGISGLFLTVPQVWETWEKIALGGYSDALSVGFTVFFVIYLLVLTRKENLAALIFICCTIFRYYFDLTYDFLPKSVFFLISGLLLLVFGFYIERRIKRKGGNAGE